MTIQVIGEGWGEKPGFIDITQSPLAYPRSLDEFDINIISLNDEALWRSDTTRCNSVNSCNDLKSVANMVKNRKKSIVVYVMPQNFIFYYNKYTINHQSGYRCHFPIKDVIESIWKEIINDVLYPQISTNILSFENTRTSVGKQLYTADFYFQRTFPGERKIYTKSIASEKITTVSLNEKTVLTTLNITSDGDALINFIQQLFFPKEKSPVPEWALSIEFGDDNKQRELIAEKNAIIEQANADIECAKQKLEENAKYKSILYANGDELVDVVFDILEKILDYDLSGFHDEKKEDFLIKLPECTFIGEIKGVTSNVKNEHVSQIDLHYSSYMDKLEEQDLHETVKQILIINPFRTKPLGERDPVHTAQIDLAIRNNCLIIETSTLLGIFEKFCGGEITTQKCKNVFASNSGLLRLEEFDTSNE